MKNEPSLISPVIHQEFIKLQNLNIRLKSSLLRKETEIAILKGKFKKDLIQSPTHLKTETSEAGVKGYIDNIHRSSNRSRNISYDVKKEYIVTPKYMNLGFKEGIKLKVDKLETLTQDFKMSKSIQHYPSIIEGSHLSSDTPFESYIRQKDENILLLKQEIECKNQKIESLNSSITELNSLISRILTETSMSKSKLERRIETLTKDLSYAISSLNKIQSLTLKHYEAFHSLKEKQGNFIKSKSNNLIQDIINNFKCRVPPLRLKNLMRIRSKEELHQPNVVEKFKKVVLSSKRVKQESKWSANAENKSEVISQPIEDYAVNGFNINFNIVEDFNFNCETIIPFYLKRKLTNVQGSAYINLKKNVSHYYSNKFLSSNLSEMEEGTFWKLV